MQYDPELIGLIIIIIVDFIYLLISFYEKSGEEVDTTNLNILASGLTVVSDLMAIAAANEEKQ